MINPGADANAGPADEPLVQTVTRLRAERDGLRRAMQTRALIEQAKGVLMTRHRLTADQAFARLLQTSQRTNVKLAEVAAEVMATVSPPPPPPLARAGAGKPLAGAGKPPAPAGDGQAVEAGAEPTAAGRPGVPQASPEDAPVLPTGELDGAVGAHRRHLLTVTRLHAAESYDDIIAALADTQPRPQSVVLLLRETDGALRLVGHLGLTPDVSSQWNRIPPQVDVPLTDAVRRGEPVWLSEPESAARVYPIIGAISSDAWSTAALPLLDAGRAIGVLGLTWAAPGAGGPDDQAFLTALGEVCAQVAVRIAKSAGLPGIDDSWLAPLLDAALGSAAVLRPVRADGRIIDFAFERLNDAAVAQLAIHGRRLEQSVLLTELPAPGAAVLLPLYRDVLADGRSRQLDDLRIAGPGADEPETILVLRAVRLGDRVVASWRARTPGELLHDEFVASERVAGVASFCWRPADGRWLASPVLAELLDWQRGVALTPLTAHRVVVHAHWPAVRRAVVAALRGGRPPTVTVTTWRGRWLRLTLAPLPGGGGLRGTVQDVSELRAALSRQHGQALARAARR